MNGPGKSLEELGIDMPDLEPVNLEKDFPVLKKRLDKAIQQCKAIPNTKPTQELLSFCLSHIDLAKTNEHFYRDTDALIQVIEEHKASKKRFLSGIQEAYLLELARIIYFHHGKQPVLGKIIQALLDSKK